MDGARRAPATQASLLMDKALALQKRADDLISRAQHPFTRDQVSLVALAARDAQTWLVDAAGETARLHDIDSSLEVQARKLDDLEDLIAKHT